MVCDIRPSKKEKFRVQFTIGENELTYMGDSSALAASLMETKLIVNISISQAKNYAYFLTIDTKMETLEFMTIITKYS